MALLQGLCSAALKIGLAMFLAMSLSRPVAAASDVISFREDIHPIIQIRCLICHKPGGDGYEKSGLDLRTYNSLMKGTKFGPIVTPGDAFMSTLTF